MSANWARTRSAVRSTGCSAGRTRGAGPQAVPATVPATVPELFPQGRNGAGLFAEPFGFRPLPGCHDHHVLREVNGTMWLVGCWKEAWSCPVQPRPTKWIRVSLHRPGKCPAAVLSRGWGRRGVFSCRKKGPLADWKPEEFPAPDPGAVSGNTPRKGWPGGQERPAGERARWHDMSLFGDILRVGPIGEAWRGLRFVDEPAFNCRLGQSVGLGPRLPPAGSLPNSDGTLAA